MHRGQLEEYILVFSIRFSKPTLCYREALWFLHAVIIANAQHVLRIDVAKVCRFLIPASSHFIVFGHTSAQIYLLCITPFAIHISIITIDIIRSIICQPVCYGKSYVLLQSCNSLLRILFLHLLSTQITNLHKNMSRNSHHKSTTHTRHHSHNWASQNRHNYIPICLHSYCSP